MGSPDMYLGFSKNFGHQNALKAGIDHAAGDCIVTIDADLQKPPEAIPEMIALLVLQETVEESVGENGKFTRNKNKFLF